MFKWSKLPLCAQIDTTGPKVTLGKHANIKWQNGEY